MINAPAKSPLRRALARLPLYLLAALTLTSLLLMACGVESGNRRPARDDEDKTGEFHRSPVAALEQFRIDVEKSEAGCTADPADVTVQDGRRVSLAIQLTGGGTITTTGTGSTAFEGERESATYAIPGLAISASAGVLGAGVTAIDLELSSGRRSAYQFNVNGAGAFDILCDGDEVGTFTVTGG